MTFWIIILVLAVVVTVVMAVVLIRTRAGTEPAAAYDLRVYRDQLKEVDRDLTRGLIGENDASRVRSEISRRILAADAQLQRDVTGQGTPRAVTMAMIGALAVVVIGGSLMMYRSMGAPGYEDLGLKHRIELAAQASETRPGQAEYEAKLGPPVMPELDAEYKELIAKLRATVAERPDDVQGQLLLVQHESRSGNMIAAHQAMARVIALKGEQASAQDYGEYAELLMLAANGYVSPEAQAALRAALTLDPNLGAARYYWGMMLGQIGRPDQAFDLWARTLRAGPADAPWIPPIRAQIEEMAARAGALNFTLPDAPTTSGPSQQDVQAAADMSDEDRQQMIQGMVAQLSARLASEGGSADEWAQLIGALGVLGDSDRAQSIFTEARGVFANDPAGLERIIGAGRSAGLTP